MVWVRFVRLVVVRRPGRVVDKLVELKGGREGGREGRKEGLKLMLEIRLEEARRMNESGHALLTKERDALSLS